MPFGKQSQFLLRNFNGLVNITILIKFEHKKLFSLAILNRDKGAIKRVDFPNQNTILIEVLETDFLGPNFGLSVLEDLHKFWLFFVEEVFQGGFVVFCYLGFVVELDFWTPEILDYLVFCCLGLWVFVIWGLLPVFLCHLYLLLGFISNGFFFTFVFLFVIFFYMLSFFRLLFLFLRFANGIILFE